ncbi:MAG: transcriptional regulator/antitoxin, MazE [Planctomycetaceae bacterium]|nr:MAG: transcriptional regulator/antitoxin, MazE [Planctomycetaceae bacterium]
MVTKVQKWGNSQGLRLSKQLLDDAQVSVGDEVDVAEVDVAVRDGVIVVAPVKHPRGKHSLQQLVKRIPKDYRTEELDWGRPAGKEVW